MREFVINLETTSRCNRKCIVCPQAFEDSGLVRKDMSLDLLDVLLQRVLEAQEKGFVIREIINAGYGETFIHNQFTDVCERYARFKEALRSKGLSKPKISIVSNASQMDDARLALALKAADILKISFPTCDPEHYGEIMLGSREQGPRLLEVAKTGLANCMTLCRDGKIPELRIHISPPVRHTHEHFPETLEFLTRMAASLGLHDLNIVAFSSTSNRAGTITEAVEEDDAFLENFYRDHRRKYHRRKINGVRVNMLQEFRVFFPRWTDLLSVLTHRFPCIWKAGSIAIDSSGNYRLCINDAASEVRLGNLQTDTLASVIERIAQTSPGAICAGCNQHPGHMGDDILRKLYGLAASVRMRLAGTG